MCYFDSIKFFIVHFKVLNKLFSFLNILVTKMTNIILNKSIISFNPLAFDEIMIICLYGQVCFGQDKQIFLIYLFSDK